MIDNNITATAIRLLNYLNLPITKKSIRQALANHERPASLLALSEALDRWKIRNSAYSIGIENFDKLPRPFLVRLTEFGGQFGFVTDVTADELVLVKEYERQQRIKLSDFEQRYAGMVLVMELEAGAGEPAYFTKRLQEIAQQWRVFFLILGLLALLSSLLALTTSSLWWTQPPVLLLGALKISGVVVTGMLLNQSFGQSNSLIEKWCKRSGTNCASVLTSPGAKIAGGLISWAELGFFYFVGTSLALLLPQLGGIWLLLRLLNIVCVCFSAYSLYYQYKIARHWCLLCCTLLALFYGELLVMSFSSIVGLPNDLELASWPILGALLAPVVAWTFFKPYFMASALVPHLTQRLQGFERDKVLFSQLLHQQPTYAVLEEALAIQLGPPQAEQHITIISNPTCGPCIRVHQALGNLLELRPDLQVQLLFSVDEQQVVASHIASTLLTLYHQKGTSVVQQALHEWYQTLNYSAWSRHYPVSSTPAAYAQLARQREWCSAHHIELTPTILVNGYQLPAAYDLTMLNYLL